MSPECSVAGYVWVWGGALPRPGHRTWRPSCTSLSSLQHSAPHNLSQPKPQHPIPDTARMMHCKLARVACPSAVLPASKIKRVGLQGACLQGGLVGGVEHINPSAPTRNRGRDSKVHCAHKSMSVYWEMHKRAHAYSLS